MHPGQRPILILAYHFPPGSASGAARPYRFYKYLREFGYRPYVIACGEASSDLEDVYYVPNPVRVPKQIAPLALTERILRKFFFPVDEGMTWTFAAWRAAANLLAEVPARAVLSTVPPLNSHLAALWLKRRFGVKWIADFRDPRVGDPFRPGGLPAKLDLVTERLVFRHADRLMTVTDPIADGWRRRYPRWADKVGVIWNGMDPEEEFPQPVRKARDYKVLAHVGRTVGARHPVDILRSLARLVNRGALDPARLRVRLIGYMHPAIYENNQSLFTSLKEKGCLEWTDDVPRTEAKAAAADADYLLLLDQNAQNIGYSIPAKLFDYMRAGHPMLVLTPRNSPLDVIFPQSGIPYLMIYPDDPEDRIDEQVIRLFALPSEPVSPSPAFLSKFDGRKHAEVLASLLDELLADSTGDRVSPAAS